MGVLNFERQKHILTHIQKILARRGLAPDSDSIWEIHGPHSPHMNYVTYVGHAVPRDQDEKCRICNLTWKKCKIHSNYYCVVIYPKGVFEIDDPAEWARVRSEDRIMVM